MKIASRVNFHEFSYHTRSSLSFGQTAPRSEKQNEKYLGKMKGVTRVAMFCSLTTILPTILLVLPLFLRHSLYANVIYTVAESDIIEIEDGISTVFCSEHTLKMNAPFNAFKVSQRPEATSSRKHIRLKKSMILPDDTLEYWGFYLLKGATVALSVCSRFEGASILVVKGERSLRTCGMMEHNENKKKSKDNYVPASDKQVEVTFQSNAQEISSKELNQDENIGKLNLFNNPLIPSAENVPKNNNIVKSNYEVNTMSYKKNSWVNKNLDNRNRSQSENSLDVKVNLLQETAINHIKKHRVDSNTTGKGIEKLRHMRKKLRQMNIQKDNNNGTENPEYYNNRKVKEEELESKDDQLVEEKFKPHSGDQELYSEHERRVRELKTELNSNLELSEDDDEAEDRNYRRKRNQNGGKAPLLLDRGVEHGGNAINFTNNLDEDSSMSSFENGLLTCYDGHVLLAQQFEPSDLCTNISFLVNSRRIHTQHNIIENGYYYYIFYSDNDNVSNDMHAVFDIYKPTFQYENLTYSCINKTECSFSLDFLSGDRVIVEVPTRDGIDNADEDLTLLTSTCRPRMGIYSIFPIAVLLLVLGCAFL